MWHLIWDGSTMVLLLESFLLLKKKRTNFFKNGKKLKSREFKENSGTNEGRQGEPCLDPKFSPHPM